MKTASITETKNRFSALINAVRHGETVIVTDRRKPVARIEPFTGSDASKAHNRLVHLERDGVLLPPRRRRLSEVLQQAPPRPHGDASILKSLLEERREGR
jgi:prevent-host-death family protein